MMGSRLCSGRDRRVIAAFGDPHSGSDRNGRPTSTRGFAIPIVHDLCSTGGVWHLALGSGPGGIEGLNFSCLSHVNFLQFNDRPVQGPALAVAGETGIRGRRLTSGAMLKGHSHAVATN